jgi:hypothetical protein
MVCDLLKENSIADCVSAVSVGVHRVFISERHLLLKESIV